MREKKRRQPMAALARYALGVAGLALGLGVQAASVRIDVVDGDGNPVSGFKYIVQEDTTFPMDPANPPPIDQMLTFGFHTSNHPPAVTGGIGVSGRSDRDRTRVTLDPGRYFVSVLPYYGHGMSGAPVVVGDTDPAPVKVIVEKHPIPTAQISVFLFEDKYPLNNAPDLPQEANPAPGEPGHVDWTQFTVVLEEPAGRYGQNGGPVLQDAFGNQLGTSYVRTCDAQGEPDADPTTNYGCLNDGLPVVEALGDGTLRPDSTGNLLIQNLPPGKYGIIVNPPTATPAWQQVTTIEGTKVIDAWVKPNEPPWFQEFGAVFPHIFMGFVQPFDDLATVPRQDGAVDATVTGTVVDTHMSRPPDFTGFPGRDFPSCWVALNDAEGTLTGQAVYAQPCATNGGSGFSIPSVPAGTYNLVIWDTNLDMIIAFQNITVDTDGTCPGAIAGGCDFGEIPVLNWFARLNTAVFNDTNQNGFWDAGEGAVGPEGGPVSIRWRDGTIYQTFPTDGEGRAPFDEVFPFFHWLVAEVGFGNKKATGATFVVDAGGEINPNTGEFADYGELQPLSVRTETGPVLTQAFQHFQGQTNVLEFGKAEYLDFVKPSFDPATWQFVGENGGISGIVHYGVTRAEDDPRFAAAETWEPGIPRVQLALYADGDIDCNLSGGLPWPNDDCDVNWNGDQIRQANDGVIDDINGNGVVDLADVDNYPLGNFPGPEDVDNGTPGVFDLGDALQVAWSDSWDDNLPIDCEGQNLLTAIGIADDRCFDGFRNWNQVRPGVFDGGYAFSEYDLTTQSNLSASIKSRLSGFYANRQSFDPNLPDAWLLPADYIVQMAVPPGYELVKEEDKNVDFGDQWIPSPQAVDPVCVGDLRRVPPYLSFATTDGSGRPARLIAEYAADPEAVAAPYARERRPLCDRKAVSVSTAQNAAANFFVMTDVPIAANASGLVNDDLNNEFNPNSPGFGEKVTLPFIPIAFYDWNEQPVHRVYTDRFGRYNAALPSSYSANLPMPSGWSPNMLVTCINDAGPIPNPDPTGPALIIDPYFNPNYYQACYTWQFMPGATTYLDTPTIPVAAFSNPQSFPADCEQRDLTPVVARVARIGASRPVGAPAGLTGPFVAAGGTVGADQRIRIDSMGVTTVPDPNWDGSTATPRTIERDYGFGTSGTVHLEAASGARTQLITPSWSDATIVARVPAGMAPGEYQVVVTRADGGTPAESPVGVTLTVGLCSTCKPDGAMRRDGVWASTPMAPPTRSTAFLRFLILRRQFRTPSLTPCPAI